MRVVAEAANGLDAVQKFIAHSPDIALIELRLPLMDGVEVATSILKKPSFRAACHFYCMPG